MKNLSRDSITKYAVAMQDQATHWVRKYPCMSKSARETLKSFNIVTFRRNPRSIHTDKFSGIDESLRRAEVETWEIYTSQIRHTWNYKTGMNLQKKTRKHTPTNHKHTQQDMIAMHMLCVLCATLFLTPANWLCNT